MRLIGPCLSLWLLMSVILAEKSQFTYPSRSSRSSPQIETLHLRSLLPCTPIPWLPTVGAGVLSKLIELKFVLDFIKNSMKLVMTTTIPATHESETVTYTNWGDQLSNNFLNGGNSLMVKTVV